MNKQPENRIERRILWAEIKVLERNFKRNQTAISELRKENDGLIVQLGEKLEKIQELAELFDLTPNQAK